MLWSPVSGASSVWQLLGVCRLLQRSRALFGSFVDSSTLLSRRAGFDASWRSCATKRPLARVNESRPHLQHDMLACAFGQTSRESRQRRENRVVYRGTPSQSFSDRNRQWENHTPLDILLI